MHIHRAHACTGYNGGVIFFRTYQLKKEEKTKKHMKKTIAVTLTLLSLLLILDSFNFGHALMMFYLAGVIPGTNIAIDAARMLEFFAVVAGFIVARLTVYIIRSFIPSVMSISRPQTSTN